MHLIKHFNRSVFYTTIFLLSFSGITLEKSRVSFTINNKPVPPIVATVNGTELTSDLLKREMIAYRLMISRQGQSLDSEDEEKIAQGLLMKAIDSELLYQQGLKNKIHIDPDTIERELNHVQSQFPGKKLFLAALAAQRLSIDVLKSKIKKELMREEFIRTEIAPDVNVSDDKVSSFYEKNKATFTQPETFQISHIYVSTPASSEGKAELAEDRAKAETIIDWVRKEARTKIGQAASAIKAGKEFSRVAEEFSEDPESATKGGDLGFIMKGQTLPAVSKVMVKMKIGDISGVIESSTGFHIIKLGNKIARRPITLDEVKPEILNHLLKLKTEKLLQTYLSKLRKKSDIKIFI